jgi:hypothetical protein
MKAELIDIPGLSLRENTQWKVKALLINGEVSLAIDALDRWSNDPAMKKDYERIIDAIQIAAQVERVDDENIVKASDNRKHGEVYEFRAYDHERRRAGKARLMFFYDDSDDALIICTNSYEKDKGNAFAQDRMFEMCDRYRQEYERNKR